LTEKDRKKAWTKDETQSLVKVIEWLFSEGIEKLTQAKKLMDDGEVAVIVRPEDDSNGNSWVQLSELIGDFLERTHRLPAEWFPDDRVAGTSKPNADMAVSPLDVRYARELLTYLESADDVGPLRAEAAKEIKRDSERLALWDYICRPLATAMERLMAVVGETRNGEKVH